MPYSERPRGYHEPLAEERTPFWADLYTWAMAQALHTLGKRGAPINYDTPASFDAHIRQTPYNKNSFGICAGTYITAEWKDKRWNLTQDQVEDMLTIMMVDPEAGEEVPLFTRDFLETRGRDEKMSMTVDMMDEGTLVFGHVPFANASGKAGQVIRSEVAYLNAFNSQSLFATKAARLKIAANQKPVFELGLRRAHCIGGREPSRAAYIGGVDATSNMEAWYHYRIPPFGSIAHAWIMMHDTELEAFVNLAEAMPHNFSTLLDTFNTLTGAENAVKANRIVAERLGREHLLKSARLDSGKLIHLSNKVHDILTSHGIRHRVKISATNDLDELEIITLEREGKVDIYGVGTKLVTSTMQPALGGVYKVNAIASTSLPPEMMVLYQEALENEFPPTPEELGRFMRDVIKLGERPEPGELEKATIPGRKVPVRTLTKDGSRYNGDIICSANDLPVCMTEDGRGVLTRDVRSVMKTDPSRVKTFPAGTSVVLPLKRMFQQGDLHGTIGTIHDARGLARSELAMLAPDHKSLTEPYAYGVGIEEGLFEKRQRMIETLRGMHA